MNDPGDGSPWTTGLRYASLEKFRRVIPPGQTSHLELPERIRSMDTECNDQVYLVGIEFTDANGARWTRDERGSLHEPSGNVA